MHQFQLRAVQGEFFVSVRLGGQTPQGEAASIAQRFASEVRFGIETNDRNVIELAQQLDSVLRCEAFRLREVDASLGSQAFKTELANRIERAVRHGVRWTPSFGPSAGWRKVEPARV